MKQRILDLKNHCIETEIKRIYESLIYDFFKAKDSDKALLEKEIKLFEYLLKNLDFGMLRSTYPPLSGGYEKRVFLIRENNRICVFLAEEGKKIFLT